MLLYNKGILNYVLLIVNYLWEIKYRIEQGSSQPTSLL